MRGTYKLLTMLGLAAGFSVVPAVGSQGSGALDARLAKADAGLVGGGTGDAAVGRADALAGHAVLEIVRN